MPQPTPAPPARHTAGPARTRTELAVVRPALLERYDAELPGARAAILSRLLGALDREALPGLLHRRPGEATFDIARGTPGSPTPPGGRGTDTAPDRARSDAATLRFPRRAAEAFAAVAPGLAVRITGPVTASLDDPAAVVRLLWGDGAFAAEVDNSVANLALARADRPAQLLPRPGDPEALGRTEQLLTDGHPLHPCCHTRGGMSVADVLAYAPEHSPVIRLRRLGVPADRWYGTAPPVLYAHPWQAERLRERYPWLVDDGGTGPCRPLMSLRTVAPVDGGAHVKTAVDVQMTSAVRTVSPAAVHNGPRLSALLRRLTADLPLEVLAETAAGAVIVDGEPRRHLGYLRRSAPVLGPDETAVPLGVLSAAPVMLSRVPDPYHWMILIGRVLFAPLATVLGRGVALEAHGQNTLVVLRDGLPVRGLYRDLGGVRVSAARLRAAGVDPPELHGDLPSDDPGVLRTKLSAAALGTVAAELIAALTRHHGADPDRLWGIVAAAIRNSPDGPRLLRDPLPIKATTAMRLAADPLDDIWAYVDNPLAVHA